MKRWIKKHSIFLTLIPVVAIMGMIYGFSAQNGESSGALSGRITGWILSVFVPNFHKLSAPKQESMQTALGWIVRKGAHFSEYALLGFFLGLHVRQLQKRFTFRFPGLWAWLIGVVYAVSDELHQGYVGGRHPAVMDVLIDSSGVLTGVALLCLILYRRKYKRLARES